MCNENYGTCMSVDSDSLVIAFLKQLQREGLINNGTYINAIRKMKEDNEDVVVKHV